MCGRKRATTVKTDRRIVRIAKIQPIITSRKIKDHLKWPRSADTVRRHLIEAKPSARSPCKAPLLKNQNWLKFAKEKSVTFDWPKEKCQVKLFFSGLVVVDSTSDDPQVLNSSHSTLWRPWSMVAQKSWYGDVFHTTALGLFIVYQGSWMSLNTSKYLKRLCCRMPKRKCPRNGCFNKTTNPNTRVSEQRLGSRQKGLR